MLLVAEEKSCVVYEHTRRDIPAARPGNRRRRRRCVTFDNSGTDGKQGSMNRRRHWLGHVAWGVDVSWVNWRIFWYIERVIRDAALMSVLRAFFCLLFISMQAFVRS